MQNNLDKKGQNLYIIEAALEYFIAILVSGAYLAKVTSSIGMSAGLTGILTAFVSLGYAFQIFALFLAGKRQNRSFFFTVSILYQACFAFIYLIPFVPVSPLLKHLAFAILLLVGYIAQNFIFSPKLAWYMSFVPEKQRGAFTSKKEIVSLVGGIVFSYLVSFVIDHFEAVGKINIAFLISALSILLIALAYSFTILSSPENREETTETPTQKTSFFATLKTTLGNRRIRRVLFVACLRDIIISGVIGFYGVYITNTVENYGLGFSMSFIALITIASSLLRVIVSRPLGRFADKYSFKSLAILGYSLLAVGFLVNAFTTAENGKILYTIYLLIFGVSMAATNTCVINLLYEEIDQKDRVGAYAVQMSVSGTVGFCSALLAGAFVDAVMARENGQLFGLYAQQWLSIVGIALAIGIMLYIQFVLKKHAEQPKTQQTGVDKEESNR